MKFINAIIILLILVWFSACNGGNDGAVVAPSGNGGAPNINLTKELFSRWDSTDSNFYFDMNGGEFWVFSTHSMYVQLSQYWIDELASDGEDITGLVAGQWRLCQMEIKFSQTDVEGNEGFFVTNYSGGAGPEHNACREWDSDCTQGDCNSGDSHFFVKSGDQLTIEWFKYTDTGIYGTSILE